MKTKVLLIVLVIFSGQLVIAQNKTFTQEQKDSIETFNYIRKHIYDDIDLTQLQNIRGTKKYVDEAHLERLKNDSIAKAYRNEDSLKFVLALHGISKSQEFINLLEKQKKISKEDQEKIMGLFLSILDSYKNYIISYDETSKLETQTAYNINESFELVKKLGNKLNELTEENEALKKELEMTHRR